MEFDDDFWEPEPESKPPGKDVVIEAAKAELRHFYSENSSEVAYLKQLQVWNEKTYFHWVTGFAVRDLLEEGFLGSDLQPMRDGSGFSLKFVYKSGNRYRERQKKTISRIVALYSSPGIARAAGSQAQTLFLTALLKAGFLFRGENTNEFGDRKWMETDHDLDFILERDGRVYGFEVKNRLEYISREELQVKIRLCNLLKIRPVFIMRSSPKTYNKLIIEAGGYAWLFEAQVYPLGLEEIVRQMRETLQLPAICSSAIPDGMVRSPKV